MIQLLALIGVPIYVGYVWFNWSNKADDGETKLTFKERLYFERQEIILTCAGALLFAYGGEGVLDSVCDVIDYAFGSNAHDLCTDIQVNNEELFYIIGGASFGSLGLWAAKYLKKKAKKKMDEA